MAGESDFLAAALAAALAEPREPLHKLALADWLEENGKLDLAHAWRWAARRGRRPYVPPRGRHAYWQRQSPAPPGDFHLPAAVFDLLPGKGQVRVIKSYRSVPAAFEALSVALQRLHALWLP